MAGTTLDRMLSEVDSLSEDELKQLQSAIRILMVRKSEGPRPSWASIKGLAEPGEVDAADWLRQVRDESDRDLDRSA